MYATINRRKSNPDRQDEARQRGREEYFPTLQGAPGFVAFYLVTDDAGVNHAITLWESRAHAEAFQPQAQAWGQRLESFGMPAQDRASGDVAIHLTSQK